MTSLHNRHRSKYLSYNNYNNLITMTSSYFSHSPYFTFTLCRYTYACTHTYPSSLSSSSSQLGIKPSSLYHSRFIVTVGSPLRLLLYLYKDERKSQRETLQYFFMRSRHSCALHGVDNVPCKSEGLLKVEWCNAPQIILFRPDEYHSQNPSRTSICFIGQWVHAVGTDECSDNICCIKSKEPYI